LPLRAPPGTRAASRLPSPPAGSPVRVRRGAPRGWVAHARGGGVHAGDPGADRVAHVLGQRARARRRGRRGAGLRGPRRRVLLASRVAAGASPLRQRDELITGELASEEPLEEVADRLRDAGYEAAPVIVEEAFGRTITVRDP